MKASYWYPTIKSFDHVFGYKYMANKNNLLQKSGVAKQNGD